MIKEEESSKLKAYESLSHGFSGGLAAMLSTIFFHPLETIRIKS